jgi:archaellum component FlaC
MSENIKRNDVGCPGLFLALISLPLLFVATLVAGYLGYIPFKAEVHTLVTIVAIFFIFTLFVHHNASYAACKVSANFALMETDLQDALRKNALTIMGKTKSTLTVRDFMQYYFRDLRDDNFAKVASMIFPMLGILGTFIAIAVSMPDFTVQSSEKLDTQISLLLSGIGTAFYASIYGISLSLWWIFFERRGLAKIERQILELENIYDGRIWKKSELVKHEHMQSELKDQKIVQTLQDTFNLDFIKDLNTQYMKNYKEMIESTTNSLSVAADGLKEASADISSTLDRLEERQDAIRAEEAMKRNIDSFIRAARELERGLLRFDESVNYTFDKIDDELADAVEKLGRMAEIIGREELRLRKELLRKRDGVEDVS